MVIKLLLINEEYQEKTEEPPGSGGSSVLNKNYENSFLYPVYYG